MKERETRYNLVSQRRIETVAEIEKIVTKCNELIATENELIGTIEEQVVASNELESISGKVPLFWQSESSG